MIEDIKKDADQRMAKSVEALRAVLKKIRTGRAHTSLLDQVTVEYYGSKVPLSQVANISVDDARTLSVTPWEKQMVAVVEKAIINSDLGLTPNSAGMMIRVPLPPLTEQRRKEMIKLVRHEAEQGKIAIRNIRRDALHNIKELLKEKEITQDDDRKASDDMQKITDAQIAQIDVVLNDKEKELMEF